MTDQGETLGVMSANEALQQAQAADKDLVLITEQAQPPVVKIIELSKYKYQLKQKESENRKNAKVQELKEVRFRPFMGEQDFEARLKKVIQFLGKGNKVRLSLMFRGREITKKEFGFDLFAKVVARTEDISTVEMPPKMLGRKLIAQLSPASKKNESKKEA